MKKVDRSSSISARNNMASGEDRGQNNSPEAGNRVAKGAGASQNQAASYRRSFRREELSALELGAMLDMLRSSNRKIGQATSRLTSQSGRTSPVPSVLGYALPAATMKLADCGLHVAEVERAPHPQVPLNHVIRQEPAPGGEAGPDGGVSLLVSRGPAYSQFAFNQSRD